MGMESRGALLAGTTLNNGPMTLVRRMSVALGRWDRHPPAGRETGPAGMGIRDGDRVADPRRRASGAGPGPAESVAHPGCPASGIAWGSTA